MGLFGRKKDGQLPILKFKNGEAFFEYHCKFMNTRIQPGSPLAALVLDAEKTFGLPVPVRVGEDGVQTAMLKVASDDGGFTVVAQTVSGKGVRLKPGDVVAWLPGQHVPKLAEAADDERFGWVGLIVAKIAPEIDENTQQMKVLSNY